MVNSFRIFLPNAAKVQAPLNVYLNDSKKNDKRVIVWTSEAVNAFNQTKTDLANATLLIHPGPMDESPVFPPTIKRTTNVRTGALALPTNRTRRQGNVDFSKLTSRANSCALSYCLGNYLSKYLSNY